MLNLQVIFVCVETTLRLLILTVTNCNVLNSPGFGGFSDFQVLCINVFACTKNCVPVQFLAVQQFLAIFALLTKFAKISTC